MQPTPYPEVNFGEDYHKQQIASLRTASENIPVSPPAYVEYTFDIDELNHEILNKIDHDFANDRIILSGLYGWNDKHHLGAGIQGYVILDEPLTHAEVSQRFKHIPNWYARDHNVRASRYIDFIHRATYNIHAFGLMVRLRVAYNYELSQLSVQNDNKRKL